MELKGLTSATPSQTRDTTQIPSIEGKLKSIQFTFGIIIAAVTLLGSTHNYVFTRSEGQKIEERLTRLENYILGKLDRIDDKLSDIKEKK